jgi:hypothetical protein
MSMTTEEIAKARRIYATTTNAVAKEAAKAKLEKEGLSLTEEAKPSDSGMSEEAIEKARRIYATTTNAVAKEAAKAKLEAAGVALTAEDDKPAEKKAEGKPERKKREANTENAVGLALHHLKSKHKYTDADAKALMETEHGKKIIEEAKKEGWAPITIANKLVEMVKSKKKLADKGKEDQFDCDALIAKEKKRLAAAKASKIKRENAPKKTPATKNKEAVSKTAERVEKNVEKRAKVGKVTVSEIEKLINEHKSAIQKLEALLKKIKSGKKFAEGGEVEEVDAESASEFKAIKDHHCPCQDGKFARGGRTGLYEGEKILVYDSDSGEILAEVRTMSAGNKKADALMNTGKHREITTASESVYAKAKENKFFFKDGGNIDPKGMLYHVQQHMSSGMIAQSVKTSKYKEIDAIRQKMISILQAEGDQPYSLKASGDLAKRAEAELGMKAKGGSVDVDKDDKRFAAEKAGFRTSKKYASVEMRGGGVYHRRNANQFGKTKGGNQYHEGRDNRSDKKRYFAEGGNLNTPPRKASDYKIINPELDKLHQAIKKYNPAKISGLANAKKGGITVMDKDLLLLKKINKQVFRNNGLISAGVEMYAVTYDPDKITKHVDWKAVSSNTDEIGRYELVFKNFNGNNIFKTINNVTKSAATARGKKMARTEDEFLSGNYKLSEVYLANPTEYKPSGWKHKGKK